MSRPSWDQFFLALAATYATRATCDRLHVGCILVVNKRMIAAGYNGSPPGEPHCDDVGHLLVDGHCRRTVHGERNAIKQAFQNKLLLDGATAYLTHSPCMLCATTLVNCGVGRIVYANPYRDLDGVQWICDQAGVELAHIPLIEQEENQGLT